MTTLTFSVTLTESNVKNVAKIFDLLAAMDSVELHLPASTSEVLDEGAVTVTKVATEPKHRKERKPLTEAEKEVIRLRFAKGRIDAAKARGEDPRPEDLDTIKKANGKAKKVSKGSKAITPGTPEADAKIKAAIKRSVEMPRNGHKVPAKPAAQ